MKIFILIFVAAGVSIDAIALAEIFKNCGEFNARHGKSHLFTETWKNWGEFKKTHNKTYSTPEEERVGCKTFLENLRHVREHNDKLYPGKYVSFKMEMNKFADMAPEHLKRLNGFNMTLHRELKKTRAQKHIFNSVGSDGIPQSINWRDKGAVREVKDQGNCGSCWAFSATGALEGQNIIKRGDNVSLSEQNLIDCSKDFGNNGCEGGLMDIAYDYVKYNGLETEQNYPYNAHDDENCLSNRKMNEITDSGFVDIPEGDEDKLKIAVATIGPISVSIDASLPSFQFYSEGVYYDPRCSSSNLDHGVLLVGYGTEDGKDYWLVKNSWGEDWGDRGYIKIARNASNHCGIASAASYPLVGQDKNAHIHYKGHQHIIITHSRKTIEIVENTDTAVLPLIEGDANHFIRSNVGKHMIITEESKTYEVIGEESIE